MGKATGFREFSRESTPCRTPVERVGDWAEIWNPPESARLTRQAARCMDCGVPFCQSHTGCPIDNRIPEWNDLVYRDRWREALDRLHVTNDFPEFTGRVCPAPCEGSCVLGITDPPVSIKSIEKAIIDRGFAEGWITPQPPPVRTGRRVTVVGSGPAGLAAASQLNRMGHQVTVYERADRIGGLLVYGIPNMKLDKALVRRRVDLLGSEGVQFVTGTEIGVDLGVDELIAGCDALLLATGATRPRDLRIPGRRFEGVHFAMDFLTAAAKRLLDGKEIPPSLSAHGKNVVVIGGGDTGTDCLATALRQGCAGLVNLELLAEPPRERAPDNPWPQWPRVRRVDYGHAEALEVLGSDPRRYEMASLEFLGQDGRVCGVRTAAANWSHHSGAAAGVGVGEKVFPAELVLLATGFLGPEPALFRSLGLGTENGSPPRPDRPHTTEIPGIFRAGDCRRGQSLVVWAIREGRAAAQEIDAWLATR